MGQFELRIAERLAVFALLAWLLAFVAVLGTLVVHSYSRLPAMDYWETIAHLDGYRHFPWAVLWEQHYEHRVLVAEVVFAIDWLFLQGREILPLVLNSLLDLGVWCTFLLVMRRSAAGMSNSAWCALFLAGIVMFWPGVAVVIAFPFLLQWIIYQFCATASFASLANGRVHVAILLAITATYSSANGLFVWPVLFLVAMAMRLSRLKMLELGVVGVLASSLFFVGYHNLGNSHPANVWVHPDKFFGYFLSFLGMPLGAAGMWTDLAAGTGSLVLVVSLAYLIWRWRLIREPAVLVLSALILITLATAFVTSLSRIPIDRRFEDAIITPGRYVNTGAHYWAALILLSFVVARARNRNAGWRVAGCAACVLAFTLAQSKPWIHDWMNQYALYQSATLAVETNVDLPNSGRTLNYADGTLATRNLPVLERRHLALYSFPESRLLGTKYRPVPGAVELSNVVITSTEAVPGGFRIIGWAVPVPRRMLVVDKSGTVIGFGAHPGAGIPIGMQGPTGHEQDEFMAYAGPTFREFEVHLIALP